MTTAFTACPDRAVLVAFIARGGAKNHVDRHAMQRLLNGTADEFDHERLIDFITHNTLIYDLTCAALGRLLDSTP